MAHSLREVGFLQPVVVRPAAQGFELVMGERRWRAAEQAGFVTIPAIVRETNDVRSARGHPKLARSKCAQDAGRRRATNLIGRVELTHAALAGVIRHCAPATTAAENLSRASASQSAVVKDGMGGRGHRFNLLGPTVTKIGVGCVRDVGAMRSSP